MQPSVSDAQKTVDLSSMGRQALVSHMSSSWCVKGAVNGCGYVHYYSVEDIKFISVILSEANGPYMSGLGLQKWQGFTLSSQQMMCTHTHTTVLQPFFRDHPGEPVPEENFWIL